MKLKLIYYFLFLKCNFLLAQNFIQTINSNWTFNQQNKISIYKATVPGCIFTDLIAAKLIPNPYYRDNETKVQWVNNTNWEYQTNFNIEPNIWKQKNIDLVFDGLDTYADVYLNKILILKTNNMFRQWRINIRNIVKEKNNTIKIVFHSAQNVVDSIAKSKLPFVIPDNARLYARKAQYQFGWDFAPKLTTCGIWKNIFLEAWDNMKIENIFYKIIDTKINKTKIEVAIPIKLNNTQNFALQLKLKNEDNIDLINTPKNYLLHEGENIIYDTITINKANLWQPNGSGYPYLYQLSVFINGNNWITKTIGIRKIELITRPDSVSDFATLKKGNGTGFYFKVNGKPIYIKGANYVPLDMFPSSITKQHYKEIINSAKQANINMLRVWGGGIYEDDYFYELCNKAGIMIWQDFMFAGSMLPNDSLFISNIKEEAEYQIKRLQHNPCIALWCGNNEIDEAWHNWGWQNQFNISTNDSTLLWENYKNIFQKILPNLVKKFDPNTNYWQSSPSIGWGKKESLKQGDCHYWGVWWGLETIETYQKKVPRFMSEYGMQSMPNFSTIKKFSLKTDWNTASLVMKLHQKHQTGFANLEEYLNRMFTKKATSIKEYINQTQILQAKTYATAIKAHRSKMPYNMGTMLWQLNDCWPGISWSIIDYYGAKKKAYYQVKKNYE